MFLKNVIDLQSQFHKYGDVAQLVERRTENPCVGGSSPLITTVVKTQI